MSDQIFSLDLTRTELVMLHDLLGDANEYNYRSAERMADRPDYDPEINNPWLDFFHRRMSQSNQFMRRLTSLAGRTKEEEI